MNSFQNMFGENNSLSVRDIIHWSIDGKWSKRYMLYRKNDGKIGLMEMDSAISADIDFDHLEGANNYFRSLKVDNNLISVTSRDEWVVYVP